MAAVLEAEAAGGTGNTAPSISNLVLSQDSVAFMEGGGRFVIEASFEVFDPDRDVTTVRIEISDGTSLTVDVPTPNPAERGSVVGAVEVSTEISGVYTAEIWVIDNTGRASNRLDTSFTIFGSAALSGLLTSEGPVEPFFNPDRTSYTATVANDVESITVTATLADTNSSMSINTSASVSGSPSAPIDLTAGENEIIVSVAASVGDDTQEYRINVTRALSPNAQLSSLTLTPGTLDQAFDPDVTGYTVELSFLAATVRITAVTEDENATIEIENQSVPSGSPSQKIPVYLQDGITDPPLLVQVRAQDGTIKNYEVVVSRRLPPLFASFTTIADRSTDAPGLDGTFESFRKPAYDGTDVAFKGGTTGEQGVYTTKGGSIRVVADINSPEPRDGVNTFAVFGDPDIDAGTIAFPGYAAEFGGIYTELDGVLSLVADNQTIIPGKACQVCGPNLAFSLLGNRKPSIHDGRVAFAGGPHGSPTGVYLYSNDVIDVVADAATPVPGAAGQTFSGSSDPSLDSSGVVFRGYTAGDVQSGIYRSDLANIQIIADRSTIIPDSADTLRFFDEQLDQSGDNVAFLARSQTGKTQLFLGDSTTVETIIETGMPKPLSSGSFQWARVPIAIDGPTLVVHGGFGPILSRNGGLSNLLSAGDILDGKRVSGASFRREGLSGEVIALQIGFDDGTAEIVLADFGFEAQATLADYDLNNSLSDTNNGPNLISLGGNVLETGYSFGENQGLVLRGVLDPGNYSIEVAFRLDEPDALAKLLDFDTLTSDSGLYLEDGLISFIDASTSLTIAAADMIRAEPAVSVHVVITRDSLAGEVIIYVDGHEQIRFTDLAAQAILPSSEATFFTDDNVTTNDTSPGFAHFIRVYDAPLSAEQVSFLARGLSDCHVDGCMER